MSGSIYDILVGMASNPETLRKATKAAQPKVRKDFDKKVRKGMVQYYLDSYEPSIYKRIEPSPIFLVYQTKTQRINDGTKINVWVTNTDVDISKYYSSNSYYHQGGNGWESISEIHQYTGRQYFHARDVLRDDYGEDNGSVQGSWIIQNFEAGIHPRTNAWPLKKRVRKMKYDPIRVKSPLEAAEKYADQYFSLDTSYQYILSELDKMWKEMF